MEEANVGLHYSEEAKISRYIFYKDLNDINLIVEDEGREYEYETIFKRMLGNKYSITSIIGVGGKLDLLKAFDSYGCYNASNPKIKNIYIADGDFDRLVGERMYGCNHFIYLKCYNIENYLLDKNAVHTFIKGKIRRKDSTVESLLNYDNWYSNIISQAYKLFVLYCTVKRYKPQMENTGRNPYYFINHEDGFEIPGSYENYYSEVAKQIDELDKKYEEMSKICNDYCNGDNSTIICGKFLLTSLYSHTINVSKKKYTKEDFRWHLLNNFDVEKLSFIKDRIERLLNNTLDCISFEV